MDCDGRHRPLQWIPATLLVLACGAMALACAESHVQPDVTDDTPWDTPDADATDATDLDADTGEAGCTATSCPPGQECVDGSCRPVCTGSSGCPGGQQCCDGNCFSVMTDPARCGDCDTTCIPEANMCVAGTCSCNGATSCEAGSTCCTGIGCVQAEWDRTNCGSCGNECADGQQCIGGTCGGSCAEHGCPEVDHGTASCDGTMCVISMCDDGWADADGAFENGCECEAVADDNGGPSCAGAHDLGTLSDASPGSSVTAEGFVSEWAPVDWYVFTAEDSADTSCDEFHVTISFDANPSDAHVFDVFKGACGSTAECSDDVEYEVALDFSDASSGELLGECPCAATPGADSNICSDNTATYYVVVELASGSTVVGCGDPYVLRISNGI